MIKGINHTIIEVPNPCNRYFERALLFVRPELTETDPRHLRTEADRWIRTVERPPTRRNAAVLRRNRRIKRCILATGWWLLGVGCGWLLQMLL